MFVPTTMPMTPSPEAQMLGQEIAGLVRERRIQRPHMPLGDVWLAFAIARQTLSQEAGGSGNRAQVAAMLAAALIAALGAMAAMMVGVR